MHKIHTSDLNDKEKYELWQEIIEQFQRSGQKQVDFCKVHGLKQDHLSYRLKQWRMKHEQANNGFIPVEISSCEQAQKIQVVFPSGYELRIPITVSSESLATLLNHVRGTSC